MRFEPYLNFDGDCAEAFRFYEKTFRGKLVALQTHGESPMADSTPPESRDRILHARLEVGDAVLMASDSPPGKHEACTGTWVSIGIESVQDAERIFAALAEGGNVHMPLAESFWAARFGMVVDRFGTPWMVNCEGSAP